MGTRLRIECGGIKETVEFDRDLGQVSREERLASCGRAFLQEIRGLVDSSGISAVPGFNFTGFVDNMPIPEPMREAIALARKSAG